MLQDRLGNTALMYAALKGREELTDRMAMTLSRVVFFFFFNKEM